MILQTTQARTGLCATERPGAVRRVPCRPVSVESRVGVEAQLQESGCAVVGADDDSG